MNQQTLNEYITKLSATGYAAVVIHAAHTLPQADAYTVAKRTESALSVYEEAKKQVIIAERKLRDAAACDMLDIRKEWSDAEVAQCLL
jgi:hypothetical protein